MLLDAISKQNKLSRLPAPEPGVQRPIIVSIVEESIHYADRSLWHRARRSNILSPKVSGRSSKECIEGYLLLSSDMAYDEAQTLLEQRYGDPYILASA